MLGPSSWVIDAGPHGLPQSLRGLVLVGYRHEPEGWSADECLSPRDVAQRFGTADAEIASLSWWWEREELSEVDQAALTRVALVNVTFGARVPLAKVPRLFGRALTREGLAALGLPIATLAAHPSTAPVYVDVEQVKQMLTCSTSTARRHLRAAIGRKVGNYTLLRA